jgi:hypothetical protein
MFNGTQNMLALGAGEDGTQVLWLINVCTYLTRACPSLEMKYPSGRFREVRGIGNSFEIIDLPCYAVKYDDTLWETFDADI